MASRLEGELISHVFVLLIVPRGNGQRLNQTATQRGVVVHGGLFVRNAILFALCVTLAVATAGCAGFGGGLGLGTAQGGSILHNQVRPGYNSVSNGFQLRSENGFTFVKVVEAETASTSILGWIANGEGGFGKIYEAARAAGGDDVINIRTDVDYNNILGLYCVAKSKWYGVAIKYNTGS